MPTGLPTQADKWEALDDFATPQLLGNVDYYGEGMVYVFFSLYSYR